MPSRTQFSNKRIIICEGEEDAAFIRALIKINNLAPFDISPIRDIGNVGGNTGFKNAILAADAINGFEKVTDVVIVADNDDDPATSFKSVIEQIRNAKQSGLSRS